MPTSTQDLTTRVDGVELISVGTHDASTGKARITAADLAAMVDAFANPAHDAAPLKLGHNDDRFQDAAGNPPSTRDGEPAYGWVENLRLSDDGRKLIGDLVGIPRMLADVMATAFRRRSVELVRQERIGGKIYAAVLTGLSLLGVQAPAVKGLADLRALFAEQLEPLEHVEVLVEDTAPTPQPDTPPVPPLLPETLQRSPQTLSSGPPRTGATMKLTKQQRAVLGIPDGATTDQVKGVLAKHGLHMADGDSYEEDNEEITPVDTPAATPVTPVAKTATSTTAVPVAASNPAVAPTAEQPPVKVAASDGSPPTAEAIMLAAGNLGLMVVDKEQFAALQGDAAAGRQARDQQNNDQWDRIIREAVKRGKLAPTAFALWRSNIAVNPELVIKLLAGLPEDDRLTGAPLGHAEAYSGGDNPESDRTTADKAAAVKRHAVWQHFGIEDPTPANAGN